jgi:hypothetical protein
MATLTIVTPEGAYDLDTMPADEVVVTEQSVRQFAYAHLAYRDAVRLLRAAGCLAC